MKQQCVKHITFKNYLIVLEHILIQMEHHHHHHHHEGDVWANNCTFVVVVVVVVWWLSGPGAKAPVALRPLGLLYTLFSRSFHYRRQTSPRPTGRERSKQREVEL
jgi:hypothetical protein